MSKNTVTRYWVEASPFEDDFMIREEVIELCSEIAKVIPCPATRYRKHIPLDSVNRIFSATPQEAANRYIAACDVAIKSCERVLNNARTKAGKASVTLAIKVGQPPIKRRTTHV